jgi:hypothetical protein
MSYQARQPRDDSDIGDGGLLLFRGIARRSGQGGGGTPNPLPEGAGEREQAGQHQDEWWHWQSKDIYDALH